MRPVATFDDEKEAYLFHAFLKKEGIDNLYEPQIDPNTRQARIIIWVFQDDALVKAQAYYEEFKANPDAKKYQLKATTKPKPAKERRGISKRFFRKPLMTFGIIALCTWLFIIDMTQKIPFSFPLKESIFVTTPLEEALLFDCPDAFVQMANFWKTLDPKTLEEGKLLPAEQAQLEKIETIPYWKGYYNLIVNWPESKEQLKLPLFEDIRHGEIYRLITPVLLHGNLLHLLFNMLWVWLLGRMIEERIPRARFFALMLCVGVVSNVVQYLMTGPAFLGYSGIITGLAGFIWMRQRVAPWEGYPLERLTALFLALYILGMVGVQVALFFFERLTPFKPNFQIANAAHVAGALVGMCLARIPLFYKEIK